MAADKKQREEKAGQIIAQQNSKHNLIPDKTSRKKWRKKCPKENIRGGHYRPKISKKLGYRVKLL